MCHVLWPRLHLKDNPHSCGTQCAMVRGGSGLQMKYGVMPVLKNVYDSLAVYMNTKDKLSHGNVIVVFFTVETILVSHVILQCMDFKIVQFVSDCNNKMLCKI